MRSVYGVLGKKLSHSFSRSYFTKRFGEMGLEDHEYRNFEYPDLGSFFEFLRREEQVKGFNVTNPYKQEIIPLLNELNEEAASIGAVNCVKRTKNGWKGFNTDAYGFSQSIKPFLDNSHERALVLGTGGAAKAVQFALNKIGVDVFLVSSRISDPSKKIFSYSELNEHVMRSFLFIVNATPVGMFPNDKDLPRIPYELITDRHFCCDLIYNPDETLFLAKSRAMGAQVMNGLSMLHLQAEKSWEIWKE